jgi:hypothetical protein
LKPLSVSLSLSLSLHVLACVLDKIGQKLRPYVRDVEIKF